MKFFIFTLFILSGLETLWATPTSTHWPKFSCDLKQEITEAIADDINRLNDFPSTHSTTVYTAKLQQLMNIDREINPQSLIAWIQQRIQYIAEAEFNPQISLVGMYKYSYPKSYPKSFPKQEPRDIIIAVSGDNRDNGENEEELKNKMIMANFSSTIYRSAKRENSGVPQFRFCYYANGNSNDLENKIEENITLLTPRQGIALVSDNIFQLSQDKVKMTVEGNQFFSIFRLLALFHEGRHSDGHGTSLGFFHTRCPADHPSYPGKVACDYNLNGSYAIHSALAKYVLYDLSDMLGLTLSERLALEITFTDLDSRIVAKETQNRTVLPQEELLSILFSNRMVINSFVSQPQIQKDPTQGPYWDDEPEKVKLDDSYESYRNLFKW